MEYLPNSRPLGPIAVKSLAMMLPTHFGAGSGAFPILPLQKNRSRHLCTVCGIKIVRKCDAYCNSNNRPKRQRKLVDTKQRRRRRRRIHAFSQPDMFSRCARVVSILVKNMSTKCSSCLNSIDTKQ